MQVEMHSFDVEALVSHLSVKCVLTTGCTRPGLDALGDSEVCVY